MAPVTHHLSVNVTLDGKECFVINQFVTTCVSMEIALVQGSAIVILAGLVKIVMNV